MFILVVASFRRGSILSRRKVDIPRYMGNNAWAAFAFAVARIRVNVRATRSRTATHSASLALLVP